MARNSLRKLNTRDLQAELERRQRLLPRLEQRHEALLRELREVDAQIAELSGDGASGNVTMRRRGRPPGSTKKRRRMRNPVPLAEAMASVMSRSKPMRVAAVAEAVRRTGYKSNARNFGTIVNQTLIKDSGFKQVGRGHYVLG